MKISKQFKLEKVASTDETRAAITNIAITREGEKAVAVATNGRTMAIVPVEIESDVELGLLSSAALKAARKMGGKNDDAEMSLNGNIAFPDGSTLPRPTAEEFGTFPRWEQVLPTEEVKFTVALDPRLLLSLADAIGCDGFRNKGIVLSFSDEQSPIRVTVNGNGRSDFGGGARGIMMPIRVS